MNIDIKEYIEYKILNGQIILGFYKDVKEFLSFEYNQNSGSIEILYRDIDMYGKCKLFSKSFLLDDGDMVSFFRNKKLNY